MATDLKIEQEADLNRHVLDMTPITWRQRREWMKAGLLFIPYLAWVGFVLLAGHWVQDKPFAWGQVVLLLILTPLCISLGIGGLQELIVRNARRSSRRLKLTAKYSIRNGRHPIRWNLIESWHLLPIPDHPTLQKLTVVYRPSSKAAYTWQWSIVLKEANQVEALNTLLHERGLAGKPGSKLVLTAPPEPVKHKLSLSGTCALVFGGTILVPALLSLAFAILMLRQRNILLQAGSHGPAKGNLVNAFTFVLDHFSSTHTFAGTLMAASAVALFCGGFMAWWGLRRMSQARTH